MNFDRRYSTEEFAADERAVNLLMLMVQQSEPAWGAIFGRCNIRSDVKTPLVSLGMLKGGIITIGINFGVFRELSHEAQTQAMMLTFQKLLTGALSTQGNDLETNFGALATELGLLLTLADVKTSDLSLYGFTIPTPKDFNLPEGDSWRNYTAAASVLLSQNQTPKPPPSPDWSPEDSDDVKEEGEDHMVLPTESGQSQDVKEQPGLADQVSRALVNQMEDRYKMSSRGLVAGQGTEWVDALFRPPVFDYRDKLRWMETGKGRAHNRRTITRINRRVDADGFRGRVRRGSCIVYCFVDTSGSRSAAHIATAAPEMRGMVARGAEVYLIQVDAAIQNVTRWDGSTSQMELFGRGGTEIQPALDQVHLVNHKTGKTPHFHVIFSDGYTDDIQCGDTPTLILLDENACSPVEFGKKVTGTDVEIATVEAPDADLLLE